jgi:hypothetical protein
VQVTCEPLAAMLNQPAATDAWHRSTAVHMRTCRRGSHSNLLPPGELAHQVRRRGRQRRVLVRVTAGTEPQPQELLVDVLGVLALREELVL